MSAKSRKILVDAAALVALAILVLLFFWKIALTNRVLAGLDVFAYFYPYRDYASEALRAGRLPLWNPYLFMGAPLLANSQVAVLYPLHWPLLWLSAPKQVAWSIVLHIWLAGAGTFLLARRAMRLRLLPAFVSAAIFALGGFLGAQVEHVNQLNVSAWLPWLLICLEIAVHPRSLQTRRWLALFAGGAIVGLILLAGHTQAAYIVLFGAGVCALLKGLPDLIDRKWLAGLQGLGALAVMSVTGLILAAGQLLPTLELSGLSVRSGGLPYSEAASFSLKPSLIFKAFLPPLLWEPPFSEYVAYVGLIGLTLACVGSWAVLRRKRPGAEALVLALLGIFLSFGAYNPVYYLLFKVIPGFDLFRAPARWLLFYSFGAALLSGIGLQEVAGWLSSSSDSRGSTDSKSATAGDTSRRARLGTLAIALLLLLELFLAGRRLAYNQPTAPAAFDSMRTAPSHLLADDSDGGLFRFLSMSDIRYDPGDMADLQTMYRSSLSEEAIYDLIVATKLKEVLAFNLPLRYRLFSVDGYDGGLLPLKDYVTLERLFLAEDQIWSDGRLRQQLRRIPPAKLLSLLNVKYIMTDKTQDVWIDDVYYDLEHTMALGEVTLTDLPDFETTHLGVVSYLTGTADLKDGTPVAQMVISSTEGTVLTRTLRAGQHTAEGLYSLGKVAHHQARIGHQWRDSEQGNDYVAVLDLETALHPAQISVRALLLGEHVHLRGLTLINDETTTGRNLSIDPGYRLVHSGDVKLYENLEVLPRAFVAQQVQKVASDEQALSILSDPNFDPTDHVLLPQETSDENKVGQGTATVEIISYEPERIQLQVNLDGPGHLVLTDTAYPGWEAEVDGNPVPLLRANLYFRAVPLEGGEHQVIVRYRPLSVRTGLTLAVAAWALWLAAITVVLIRIGRKSPSSV
ncbi:MAG TPA: YfhO family protein [Anaerolineae bacterium]|nr:YfhO family protein [Anaerolineae bacterium]